MPTIGIELNLRLPSMLQGKKGFDRLLSAARHTLNVSKLWLFVDLSMTQSDCTGKCQFQRGCC